MCENLWLMLNSQNIEDKQFAIGIITGMFHNPDHEQRMILRCIQDRINHKSEIGECSWELKELELRIYEILNH
jgi:hypothetical protein